MALFDRSTKTEDVPKTEEHIFRSPLPDIQITNHLPLHSYLFENLSQISESPCLIVGTSDKIYSYAETHLLCRMTIAGMFNLGINKGDVIMILLQNCPEFVFSFFEASMIGVVITTANPFYTSSEIFKQLHASNPNLIITLSTFVDKLKHDQNEELKFDKDLKVVTVDDPPQHCLPFTNLFGADEGEMLGVEISPKDPIALSFPSGTAIPIRDNGASKRGDINT